MNKENEQPVTSTGSCNTFTVCEQRSMWPEVEQLPRRTSKTEGQNWDVSDKIWIRVRAAYEKNEKTGEMRLIWPAYSVIGRCVWPKVPLRFDPVGPQENPAVRVVWGDGEPFYEVQGKRVDASHWYPLVEPIPPGEIIPTTISADAMSTTVIWQN